MFWLYWTLVSCRWLVMISMYWIWGTRPCLCRDVTIDMSVRICDLRYSNWFGSVYNMFFVNCSVVGSNSRQMLHVIWLVRSGRQPRNSDDTAAPALQSSNHTSSLIINTYCYLTGRYIIYRAGWIDINILIPRAHTFDLPDPTSLDFQPIISRATEQKQQKNTNRRTKTKNATNKTRNLPPNQPPRPRIRPTQQPRTSLPPCNPQLPKPSQLTTLTKKGPLKPPLPNLLPPRPLRGHPRSPILHRLRILLPRHDHRLRLLPRSPSVSIWWKGRWVVFPGCWGWGDWGY